MDDEKFLFIDELPAFLLEQRGLRLSVPTLHKMTCIGTAPPSAGYWGKRRVYKPSDVIAWADAHIREHPGALGPKKMPAGKAGKKVTHDNAAPTRPDASAQ